MTHERRPDFVLTPAELAGIAAASAPLRGRLSLVPPAEREEPARAHARQALAQFSVPDQTALRTIVGTLAAPAKVAELHTTLADERVTAQVLAWSRASEDEDVAFLAPSGDRLRVGTESLFVIKAMVRDALAATPELPTETLSARLSSQAVLTLLGIIDHLRYARRYSELVYEAPFDSFTPREVLARFQDAETDDFRWPLLFVEKLLPQGVTASYSAATISAGLEALAQAELVEPLADRPEDAPLADSLYRLLPAGEAFADTVVHEVSKVALSISECLPGVAGPDGSAAVGQDIALLVRGGLRLVLFMLSGGDGLVALVDRGALDALLDAWFEPPSPEAVTASQTPAPAAVSSDFSARRRTATPHPATTPGDRTHSVQPGLPRLQQRICPNCGAPVVGANRFCIQCGQPFEARSAATPGPLRSASPDVATPAPDWTPIPPGAASIPPRAPEPQPAGKPPLGCYLGAAAGAALLALLVIGAIAGAVALLRSGRLGATLPPAAVTATMEPALATPAATPPDTTPEPEMPTVAGATPEVTSESSVDAPTLTLAAVEDPGPTVPSTEPPAAPTEAVSAPETPALTGEQFLDATMMWEDFSSKALGWSEKTDENGGRAYVNGTYVLHDNVGMYIAATIPIDFVPTGIEFEATLAPGLDDGEYGVICHFQDGANWDTVAIHPTKGSYSVVQLIDDEYTNLTEPLWQAATGLDTTPGATNYILVECNGDEIGLFINRELVGRFALQAPRDTGSAGLYVYGYRDDVDPFTVIFDNVRAWIPVQ